MAKVKAVIFDMGGVFQALSQMTMGSFAKELGVPLQFVTELMEEGGENNAFYKLERGELVLSEYCVQFELDGKEKAKRESIDLPNSFTSERLFQAMSGSFTTTSTPVLDLYHPSMLCASTVLRNNGIVICALTNDWIDEHTKIGTSRSRKILKNYFNIFLRSSYLGARKPEARIYEYAIQQLPASAQECVFLDDTAKNIAGARAVGIRSIQVDVNDPNEALKELGVLTNLNLLGSNYYFPAPSTPHTVVHGYVEVKSNVTIHFVESGEGPVVILLHGFLDCWYGWRHQIPALANAGYRVIALDQRGYGKSSFPDAVDEFSQKELTQDVLSLMDKLNISLATVVGHDWGSTLAWSLALKYPERFRGVCGVNTPFFKIDPLQDPLTRMKENPGVFDYQLYFQTPGVAEQELERDIERTLTIYFENFNSATKNVPERGGMLVGFPAKVPLGGFMSPADMKVYVDAFSKHGFRGPLNWFRNYQKSWEWLKIIAERKIKMPALMVTASDDMVWKPEYSDGMEHYVLNLDRLRINQCGHWTMQEKALEFNEGLIKWLDSIHNVNTST